MSASHYTVDEARRFIADQGLIARVSAQGGRLVIYDGDEENPGTWMEVDAVAIRDGMVSARFLASFAETSHHDAQIERVVFDGPSVA